MPPVTLPELVTVALVFALMPSIVPVMVLVTVKLSAAIPPVTLPELATVASVPALMPPVTLPEFETLALVVAYMPPATLPELATVALVPATMPPPKLPPDIVPVPVLVTFTAPEKESTPHAAIPVMFPEFVTARSVKVLMP